LAARADLATASSILFFCKAALEFPKMPLWNVSAAAMGIAEKLTSDSSIIVANVNFVEKRKSETSAKYTVQPDAYGRS
jgi:hypothetical protein